MLQVLILVGLPASGKSTYATELLLKEPGQWIRTNKDLLREMAYASHWTPYKEEFIIKLRDTIILMALELGKHVIVDDTNFGPHIEHIKQLVQGKANIKINDSFLKTPLEECIKRDLKRPNSVGKEVILEMYHKYINIPPKPPVHQPELPNAIIVDLDGTLAIIHDRHPFDATKCEQDLPNQPVIETVLRMQATHQIILVSGRQVEAQPQTENWLKKHQIPYNALYMRQTGDLRKDSIIKQEIYDQHIRNKYNILFILDDRNQVVEMWRSLGLTVFQVAQGNF